MNLRVLLYKKTIIAIIATALILVFTLQVCCVGESFRNSDPTAAPKAFSDVIKWQLTKKLPPKALALSVSNQWRSLTPQSTQYAVWIGHATYLINTGDITLLTDPIFSDRASPVGWAGPERLIPPAIPLAELPSIDVVVVSHNHYDHLDLPSLKALQKKNPDMLIFVPQGDKKLLDSQGLTNVSQFRWWQNAQVKQTKLTFSPVQHWSGRGITLHNTSLWGGWFLESPDLSVYHAGDTGYSKDFLLTQERLGAPDVAFIPIGAYKPRWFMQNQHMDPAEAVQVALDLQAPRSFGMHWGTFVLTDETITEPPILLAQALAKRNLVPEFFIAPTPGAILRLNP